MTDVSSFPTEPSDEVEGGPALPAAGLAAGAASVTSKARAGQGGEGRGPASVREIWDLAWPVMLSQIFVTSVGIIDIAMVGRLGPNAVAAVGYATQFYFMSQSALFAVGFACVALMSQAIGAGDPARARAAMAASVSVAFVTALIIAAAFLTAPLTLLHWLNAEPHVAVLSLPYMRLVFASSLLLAFSMTVENGLRADKKTVTAMRVAILVTVVKVVLNAALIFGLWGFPRWELVGAGVATIVSQLVAVLAFGAVLFVSDPGSPVGLRPRDIAGAPALIWDVVRVAVPGIVERVVLNFALLAYFSILGTFGTVAVAAYTVGVRVLSFSWIPGVGFGAATATLVGQALGAGDEDGAEATGWLAAKIALVAAVGLGTVCGVLREPLSRLFTEDPATVAVLGPFMLTLAVAQPLLQLHFTLGGAHRGAGDTWTPMLAATVGNWVFRVPLALIGVHFFGAGIEWVWAALVFDHGARALWLTRSFRTGAWKRRALV